ncbi:MAG: CpaF family protein, partial [Acidimicrobiia bacterium]
MTVDLGPLEPVLADATVTEVLLNGPGRAWMERAGRLEPLGVDLDEDGLRTLVERVIAPLGLRLDRGSPILDARLPDGSRLHAVIAPVALDGTCITIRRFPAQAYPLADFIAEDEPDDPAPRAARVGSGPDLERLLRWAVAAGWNLLVAGGTGAGKTSLVNTLSALVAPGERIVTVEETAELRLAGGHVVRLEARPPNAEGAGAVPVRTLVRAALRLRPDRLIVGEVRGPEAFDLVQALNTGHDGSFSTIHANGCGDALTRLESLVLLAGTGLPLTAARAQVAACVDAVVHVARQPGRGRHIEAVAEVGGGGSGVRLLYPGTGLRPRRPARRSGAPA